MKPNNIFARIWGVAAIAVCSAAGLLAADLGGTVFHDLNGNGLRDAGEEGLPATVEVFGARDAGGAADIAAPTQPDGSFFLGPAEVGDGCYLARVNLPSGFRLAQASSECDAAGLGFPVGTRRYASPRSLLDAARSGSILHISLGDSIAEPASACVGFSLDATDYISWFADRLKCVDPSAETENHAIAGSRTWHLLEPKTVSCGPPMLPHPPLIRCNNVFDAISSRPDLITISIGGNDWLASEPTILDEPFDPQEVRASVQALINARSNVQEVLCAIAGELPLTDVIVNTVYNPQAYNCGSPGFYNIWMPIWTRMLRDVVWGQGERFHLAEIAPEYAHQDVNGNDCCGEQDLICSPLFDGIHPNEDGAQVHLEKVWEAAGGVNLGARDGIGASSNQDLFFPAVELVATRFPTVVVDNTLGAADTNAVLARDGLGASVPSGDGTLIVSGFDARMGQIVPTQMVVVVRYRTDAPVPAGSERDEYFFEASIDGTFSDPDYTVTGWNTIIPIVGAGSNAPVRNAIPDVPQWRESRALLSKNAVDDGRASGRYRFPPPSWFDVRTLAVRFRGGTKGAGADPFHIEWDAAWLEVYGYTRTGQYSIYMSDVAQPLVAQDNLADVTDAPPYDHTPPGVAQLFYAVDDGSSNPGRIFLVKQPAGALRISW